MATIDQILRNMADSLRGLTRDIVDLKSRVNRLQTLESGGFYLPTTTYGVLPNAIASSASVFVTGIPRQLVLLSWKQSWYLSSGDATSNYWTVKLWRGGTTITTFDTKSGPWGTWNRNDATSLDTVIPESDDYLNVEAVKTGTPGSLVLACPMLYVV
jgi:hypothetical protein